MVVGFERVYRVSGQFRRLGPCAFDTEKRNQGRLALLLILAHRLTGLLTRTDDVEKIVRNLIDEAEVARVFAQPLAVRGWGLGENCTSFAGEFKQRAGFHPLQGDDIAPIESA